jgi:hypothetical protein
VVLAEGWSVRLHAPFDHLRAAARIDHMRWPWNGAEGVDMAFLTIWFALFGGAVVTIGFTLFFGTEDLRLQAIMTGILSFLIFSGLLTLIGMNHPYAGAVKVGPEALSEVLEEIRSRPERVE